MSERDDRGLDRRDFLIRGAGALGAGLLGTAGASAFAADGAPRVRRYVPLGRTGMEISDISFGSSRTSDPDVVRHAFERGVNYFDSAEGYKDGDSEEAIGAGLAGVRDKVFITSKTKADADAKRGEMMTALEGSLRRLRTDTIDVYFNHAVNDVDRMGNEEWHEFTAAAKKQGKIRFRGMSGHAGRLVEAFHQKMFNAFDFVTLQPELPPVLARAHREGVGVVAMKTLMGARANDMRPYESGGSTFAQAAFKWTLSNPDVDALVISMKEPKQIDEYLGASGAVDVGRADRRLLETYAAMNGARYCQHGCDRCSASCPAGVSISEVLRTRMYDVDYGDPELARRDYAQLGAGAGACLACAAAPCAGACPNGLPIPDFTRDAARRLG
jgi:predicted aldo/keto reductase-like oxidoreductase